MALLREIDGEEDAREGNHSELLSSDQVQCTLSTKKKGDAFAPPKFGKPEACPASVLLHRLDRNVTKSWFHLWHRDHHFEHSVVQLGLNQVRFRSLGQRNGAVELAIAALGPEEALLLFLLH